MDLDDIDIGTNILELSGKNLTELPEKVFKFKNIRMLCLDNNQLTSLPPNMFEELSKLRWLDLRNNKLQQLPPTIQKCTTLETLILQNNQIQELPLELALLTNLKNLHLSGNPLLYPTPDVVQQGINAIQKCLIDALQKKTSNEAPKPQKVHKKKAQKRRNFVPPKKNSPATSNHQLVQLRRSKSALSTILPPVEIKPYNNIIEVSVKTAPESSRHTNSEVDPKDFSGTKLKLANETGDCKKQSRFPITNSERYLSSPNMTRSELRQQEQNLKDIWSQRLRQLLERQASLIQKQKTVEALKNWRQQINKYSQRSLNYGNKSEPPPFDTDPNYDKMPSRHELSLPQKEFKVRSLPNEKIDINAKIDDIIKSIKRLDTLQSSTISPHQEQIILEREIKKLNQIQNALTSLKYLNDEFL